MHRKPSGVSDEWDRGTTEPGSSGAPLFNFQHQVIGNLTGGEAVCSLPVNDYFSKIYKCWNLYREPTRQLSYWLDPDKTEVVAIKGYDPYNPEPPPVPIERFTVYPNPSDGHFSVETDTLDLAGARIRLYRPDGKLLGSMTASSSTAASFDFSRLNPGVYILEIRIREITVRKKIIIVR